MSHTPGPWFAHDFSGINDDTVTPCDFAVSCTTPDHLTVATMGMGLTGTREEWESNVKLIAAAPELLEALERIKATGIFLGVIPQQMMDEVIAKARGEA